MKLDLKQNNDYSKTLNMELNWEDIKDDYYKEYKKEWITWGDFLGTGSIANTVRSANFLLWPEAKQKMRKLGKEYGLKGFDAWRKFAKTHGKLLAELNLPINPWMVYTKEKVWKRMKK